MARTLSEIVGAIKADFIANETLAAAYGFDQGKTFDQQFPPVSIEGAIIYIVGLAVWLLEKIVDTAKTDVAGQIESNYMCSVPWYHAICMEYQDGHDLAYDGARYRWVYVATDPDAQIIKHVAIREAIEDGVAKLKVMVSKEGKEPLTAAELARFSAYLFKRGAAGMHYSIVSTASDRLRISAQVNYNPLVLDGAGARLLGGGQPVNEAIQSHIDGIVYGGTFNKTKLTDAIQKAEGVVDVILLQVQFSVNGGAFNVLPGNSLDSTSGSFVIENSDININYLPQNEY